MQPNLKRTETVKQKETLQQYGGLRSTRWKTPEQGKSVLEISVTHTPTALQSIPEHLNYLTPPPHWHWYQDEFFNIKEGRFIFTLEGEVMKLSASDPQPIHIPATARHTFRVDDTHEGPCTIEISTKASPNSPSTEPETYGANEKFFRNLYSYLDDCYMQKVSPSSIQLLVFLDSAEQSLAFPGPAWLARPASYMYGLVVGRWIGRYIMGYKASYPEYWSEVLENRKNR